MSVRNPQQPNERQLAALTTQAVIEPTREDEANDVPNGTLWRRWVDVHLGRPLAD